jgi:hypothetical protein
MFKKMAELEEKDVSTEKQRRLFLYIVVLVLLGLTSGNESTAGLRDKCVLSASLRWAIKAFFCDDNDRVSSGEVKP